MKLFKILIFLILLMVARIFFSPITWDSPQEKYFYTQIEQAYKQGKVEVPLKNTTNFTWDKCYWLGPYSGFNLPTLIIDGTTHDMSVYGNDINVQDDSLWALIFIYQDQIAHIVQAAHMFPFDDHKLLHFSRTDYPSGLYYPNDILRLNNQNINTHGGYWPVGFSIKKMNNKKTT